MQILTKIVGGRVPAVEIRITGAKGTLLSIERSDRNGVHPIRATYPLQLNGEQLSIIDYEPAFGKVTYQVNLTPAPTTPITASIEIKNSLPVLHSVFFPLWNTVVNTISDYSQTQAAQSIITPVYGSPYPAVQFAPMESRKISLTAIFSTYAAARAALHIVNIPNIFMLRQWEHDGLDAYLIVEESTISANNPNGIATSWQISFTAREVDYPQGIIQAAAINNYGQALEEYATYAEAFTGESTYEKRIQA